MYRLAPRPGRDPTDPPPPHAPRPTAPGVVLPRVVRSCGRIFVTPFPSRHHGAEAAGLGDWHGIMAIFFYMIELAVGGPNAAWQCRRRRAQCAAEDSNTHVLISKGLRRQMKVTRATASRIKLSNAGFRVQIPNDGPPTHHRRIILNDDSSRLLSQGCFTRAAAYGYTRDQGPWQEFISVDAPLSNTHSQYAFHSDKGAQRCLLGERCDRRRADEFHVRPARADATV